MLIIDSPFRRLALAAVILLAGLSGATGPALAQEVPQLNSTITDQTGRLSESREEIADALQRLADRTGVQLYVLFVNTTEGVDVADYAREVGEANLGTTDALLVVAIDDQTDNIRLGPDLLDAVSQTEIDRIRTEVLEPRLTLGDLGGGVVRVADALAEALVPGGATQAPQTDSPTLPPATPPTQGSGGGFGVVLLLLLGAVVLVGVVALMLGRRRRPTT